MMSRKVGGKGLTVLKEIKNLLPRESIVRRQRKSPLWFQIKRNCGKIYFSGHPYGKRMQPGPGEKQ